MSVNQRRMNRIPRSSTVRSTYSASADRAMSFERTGAAVQGGYARVNVLVTHIHRWNGNG